MELARREFQSSIPSSSLCMFKPIVPYDTVFVIKEGDQDSRSVFYRSVGFVQFLLQIGHFSNQSGNFWY